MQKTLIIEEENHRRIQKYRGELLFEGEEVSYSKAVNLHLEAAFKETEDRRARQKKRDST